MGDNPDRFRWSRWTVWLTCGLTQLFSTAGLAQAVLTGIIRHDSTGRPLPQVEVLLEGSQRQTSTDASGRYVLAGVPAGTETVLIRLIGYRPQRQRVVLNVGDTTWLNVELVPRGPQELEPVEVTAVNPVPMGLREGFEERRRMGFGKFIDLETLKKNEHRKISDLLRAIAGVRLIYVEHCLIPGRQMCYPPALSAAGTRAVADIMAPDKPCWMSVYFDGMPVYQSGPGSRGKVPPDFSKDFNIWELEGVEVYRSSAELPTEFSGATSECGVIALWSRRAQ